MEHCSRIERWMLLRHDDSPSELSEGHLPLELSDKRCPAGFAGVLYSRTIYRFSLTKIPVSMPING